MKIRILISVLLLGTISSIYAQEENPLNVKIIPPGPEASALGKFIDMPVSPYSGTPKIEVPIYELKSYELTLPISLSYHASGIKMEELSSFVGAGWALNAGGILSRTIRSLHDEFPTKGYFSTVPANSPFSVTSFIALSGIINHSFLFDNVRTLNTNNCQGNLSDPYAAVLYASRGGLDLEPDLYFFSLPDGQSGKFVFSRDKTINFIPKQYVNISYTEGPNGDPIMSWTIIGRDGTKYIFDTKEFTTSVSECSEPSGWDVEAGQPDVPDGLMPPSTWRISKIISASTKDTISFTYEGETHLYEFTNSTTTFDRFSGNPVMPYSSACATQIVGVNARLKKIKNTAGYEVEFVANSPRLDMGGAKKLDRIIVKYKGTELKAFDLSHTYNSSGTDIDQNMLMLTSIRESSNGQYLPAYEFTYYPGLITGFRRSNPNVDHWGYSNGQTGNLGKAPQMMYENLYYGGANRQPNLDYCKQWSLKELKYPTAGRTEFEYELHDFSNVPSMQSQPFQFITDLEEIASIEFDITSDMEAYYSDIRTFSLPANTNVIYVYTIPFIPGGLLPTAGCNGFLRQGSTDIKLFNTSGPEHAPIETLAAGNYTLTAEFDPSEFVWDGGQDISQLQFSIKIYKIKTQDELIQNNSLKGGGLRIKKITAYGDNTLTKTYTYTQPGSAVSSGKIMAFPAYATLSQVTDATVASGCFGQNEGAVITRIATSNLPLTMTQGSYVGYDVVTEFHGTPEANNGYTVYKYENTPDATPTQTYMPIVPAMSYSYKNGLLKEQTDYTTSSKPVKKVVNTYRFLSPSTVAPGMKVAQILRTACTFCPNRMFNYNFYEHFTERIELGETLTRVYDVSSDNYQEHKAAFYYDAYDQVDYTEELSDLPGKKLFRKFKYNITDHTAVTEKYSYYSTNTTSSREYKEGQQITYNSFIKPATVSLLEPQAGSVSGEPTGYVSRLSYSDFDTRGNVLSYLREGSEQTRTSLIWGYNDLFPIAQAVGAPVTKIAHTSFEDGGEGGWVYSTTFNTTSKITGERGYNLSGGLVETSPSKSLQTGETFVVTFWSTSTSSAEFTISTSPAGGTVSLLPTQTQTIDGTTWVLHTYNVVPNSANSKIRVARSGSYTPVIDELRLYPVGSQMTTYTYSFKNGMTTSTDNNNFTSYYEYDNLRRLYRVKDFAGNILKQLEYHYQRDNN